ncbi:MAG: hypothetical protein IPL08_05225 [Saprospiraceae bacterium]|nr:hypothetical protein [Saprospiraceae bacterium]
MGIFDWIFRQNKKDKRSNKEIELNDGNSSFNEKAEPIIDDNHQNDAYISEKVKRIKLDLKANIVSSSYDQGITLEAIIEDKMFPKDNPIEYEAFLNELKVREPEIFKQRFGDGNDDWKTLNNIYPIIKNRVELKSLIEWENGQIKPGSAMDGLVVIELFDDILLTFGLDKGGQTFERLKISHFSDFERVGQVNVLDHAYINFKKKIKDTISMDIYPSGIGMLIYCGGKESSLITDERVWNQIQSAINSKEIVFSIPTQDIFIFCGKNSTESIELLKENTFGTFSDPSLSGKISSKLFLRNEFGVVSVFAMDYYPLPE